MTGEAINKLCTVDHPIEWFCPQLVASPKASIEMVMQHIETSKYDRLIVMGSSLGGYYANYLAEKYACKAVVLNPAVRAPRELKSHVGMLTEYDTNEPYDFRPEFIHELKDLQIETLSDPSRYFLMAAKGDELLDWQEMVEFYKGAEQLVLEGSDHGISEYADHLPQVLRFISH
jgi:predicted esterase YcpF (UPF0227 family)